MFPTAQLPAKEQKKPSQPVENPWRLSLRSPTLGVMDIFFFSGENMGRKQSLALDLGLGVGFPASPSPRYSCSSSKKERGLNVCQTNRNGVIPKILQIAHSGHLLCCHQHPLISEFLGGGGGALRGM